MHVSLSGHIALVTGGSRGLGKAISMKLAEAGATVVVNYAHNQAAAADVVHTIQANGGQAVAMQADVTDENSVKQLMQRIEQHCGGTVDILVNNATGPQPEVSIEESTWDVYMDQLLFAVKAPLLLTQAVLPGMKEKGEGRIMNIGSEVVQLGNTNFANYVTAKSAMLGMTRSWANELGKHGITVNLINPGFIPVERHADVDQTARDAYAANVPLGKMGEPFDIGNAVVFLASPQAKFITGQSLSVNGGHTFGI